MGGIKIFSTIEKIGSDSGTRYYVKGVDLGVPDDMARRIWGPDWRDHDAIQNSKEIG